MIRGSQTITKIFSDETQKVPKGTFDRDVCLCYRYYFYYELLQRRHDRALEVLEVEFFISQDTITKRLTACADLLKDIAINKPKVPQLRRKYPHLVWN
ncbi:hypothetical protein [Sphingobacterium sp. LRF_L2]|uniref:hypothetical protein n=1 Tax=Sphingobacterium sp. LRF_L2 TaxID=3369421 RepID=UPI003F5EBB2C